MNTIPTPALRCAGCGQLLSRYNTEDVCSACRPAGRAPRDPERDRQLHQALHAEARALVQEMFEVRL